ncbi:MAG TPA: hypothetical protein VJ203_13740 [Bacteroidales bacterium]|nr:hypothetical protein [Bacteroidales bacterium]
MKKLDFPEGYGVYHIDQERLFALDPANSEAINQAFLFYQSYMNIPEDKEVECFVMDYDLVTNTCSVNFEKKTRIKMNLLMSLPYWLEMK